MRYSPVFQSIVLLAGLSATSFAATWTVTNSNDSGAGSLRNAISQAGSGDTVNFNLTYPATISLSSGALTIQQNLTISGPGSSNLAISGGFLNRLFSIASANVSISGLTLTGGADFPGASGTGGAILNSGTLNLANCTVSGSFVNASIPSGQDGTSTGGAIANSGTMTLTNCLVTGNTAGGYGNGAGGAIYNSGTLTITGSTISGNAAEGGNGLPASGGGIYNVGTLTITGSTISGNTAYLGIGGSGSGGGIFNAGNLALTNSTLYGNSAATGGAIFNANMLTLAQDTLAANGLASFSGIVTAKSTIFSNGAPNCSLSGTALSSAGYNLSDDTSCAAFLINPGDLNNIPAGLDPNGLQNNGGPTQTVALLPGSPALDSAPVGLNGYCTAADGVTPVPADQRSVSRPQGSACDIGAFELTSSAGIFTIGQTHAAALALGQTGTFTITVSNAAIASPTSGVVTVTDALPAGLTLVSMAGTGWSCISATCTRSDVLAPGASYPPITVTVNVAATAVSPAIDTATVSGGNSSSAISLDSALLAGAPMLSITKSHSGSFALGQQGGYTITVSNAAGVGPTSGNVTVTDTLPIGLGSAFATGSGWACTGSLTCTRSDLLAPGASYPPITLTVVPRATATSPQVNEASVGGGLGAGSTVYDPTVITGVPVLSIVSSHTGNFTLGQEGAAYTLTVSNAFGAGPTSSSSAVSVAELLPGGLSLVSMGGSGWTCAANNCSRNDVLPAASSYPPITVTVNVAAHAASPQINVATVTWNLTGSAGTADPTTIVGVPILSIAKSHTGNFGLGQQGATYLITVSNAAGAGPTNGAVTVSDILPNGLSLVSMAGSGWKCSANVCSRSDSLAAGASYPTITVTVNVASNATAPVNNYATVSGGGSMGANVTDATSILPSALSITKTHTGNFLQGQTGAAYALTVFNTGSVPTIGTVTVTDALPTGLTLVSMEGYGWSCASATCTRSDALGPGMSYPVIGVTVGVSATAPSQVTNSATVSGGGSPNAVANDVTTISPPLYSVSGVVTVGGAPMSGVTVMLSGSYSEAAVTGANGSYSLPALSPNGAYTLWASLASYSFNGPVTITNPTGSQIVNFTGVALTGLEFYPVTPCRLADTRVSSFQSGFGPPSLSAGATRTFNIPSNTTCGIPANSAAYSLNVTAVTRGYLGILTIWPAGQTMPNASTLNSYSTTPTAIADAAIVPAGANGGINVWVTDATDLVLDIDGYFAPPQTGALAFYPVAPCRLVDTRSAAIQFGPPSMPAGSIRSFPIPANVACAIPATATAYSLNVTAVPQKTLGILSIFPTGTPLPNVSTLNVYNSGTVVANAAIVPAGTNGAVSVYVTDATDLVVDIDGYFAPLAAGGLKLYPSATCRVADTRVSSFPPGLGVPSMTAGSERTFAVTASPCVVPSGAGAYSFNFTAVPQAQQLGALIAWPAGRALPNVSTMNSYSGSVVSNAAIVPAGTGGAIMIYVTDSTDVLFDINGYFAP